jgi:hypothetical protein
MEWLAGFCTGCHFKKGWKFLALPRRANPNRPFLKRSTPTTRYRGGTKLTFITCRDVGVKPFGGMELS